MAPDLDVPLLQHVEQAHLDALGQVGELVDGEHSTVGAGHQAVVDGELIGEVAALGHLDGIDLADEVGDGSVGRGQLLPVALAAMHPGQRGVVALCGDQVFGVLGHRVVGIVVHLGAGHDGEPLVEQVEHQADHPGLGLASLAQEDDVVAGQQGGLHLGNDGVFVAPNAGEQVFAGSYAANGVLPDLVFDRD